MHQIRTKELAGLLKTGILKKSYNYISWRKMMRKKGPLILNDCWCSAIHPGSEYF